MSHERIPGINYRNSLIHKAVEANVWFHTNEIMLHGRENLSVMRQFLSDGSKIFITPNHLSNYDGPGLSHVMDEFGFRDIAHKLVYARGMKLDQSPWMRRAGQGYNNFTVWPPRTKAKNEEEKRLKEAMNRDGLQTASAAVRAGHPVVIYPEGTRSRDQQLARGISLVEPYFEQGNDTVIFPVAMWGSHEIFPIEGQGKRKRGSVEVTFADPISLQSLHEQYGNPTTSISVRQKIIDDIMIRVASGIPEGYRGYYETVFSQEEATLDREVV